MIMNTLRLGLFCALMGGKALATPPDVITLQDQLIGLSETHLFILRHVNDNHGRYIPGQTDLLLVMQEIDTNFVEILPVYRAMQDDEAVAGGMAYRLRNLPLDGRADPYAILAAAGALPVIMTAMAQYEDVTQPEAGPDDLAAFQRALADTAAALGEYDRFGPLGVADVLLGPTFSTETCTISPQRDVMRPESGRYVLISLLTCAEIDGPAGGSILLARPAP